MSDYFQIYQDSRGDIWVADGLVMQPRTGVIIPVGMGAGKPVELPLATPSDVREVAAASGGMTLVGGSGRNLILTTTVAGIPRVMRPYRYGFIAGDFTCHIVLPVPGTGAESNIEINGDIIAKLTGSYGEIGTYAATTLGKTMFNGGAAFNIVVTQEITPRRAAGDTMVYLSAGTAQAGIYQVTYIVSDGTAQWASAVTTDWTLVRATESNAELRYLDNVVAIRTGGDDNTFEGSYFSTPYGSQAFGEAGAAWEAQVQLQQVATLAGVVYVRLLTPSGTLSSVKGPFFAAGLPAPATNDFCVQLGHSDGTMVVRDWCGAVMV